MVCGFHEIQSKGTPFGVPLENVIYQHYSLTEPNKKIDKKAYGSC